MEPRVLDEAGCGKVIASTTAPSVPHSECSFTLNYFFVIGPIPKISIFFLILRRTHNFRFRHLDSFNFILAMQDFQAGFVSIEIPWKNGIHLLHSKFVIRMRRKLSIAKNSKQSTSTTIKRMKTCLNVTLSFVLFHIFMHKERYRQDINMWW